MDKPYIGRWIWRCFIALLYLSCAKQSELPKTLLNNNDCVQSLREKLEENNCLELEYITEDYSDALIRCHREDSLRKNIWDTNWFRFSLVSLHYPDPEVDYFIKTHTICVDKVWRVESYFPQDIIKHESLP